MTLKKCLFFLLLLMLITAVSANSTMGYGTFRYDETPYTSAEIPLFMLVFVLCAAIVLINLLMKVNVVETLFIMIGFLCLFGFFVSRETSTHVPSTSLVPFLIVFLVIEVLYIYKIIWKRPEPEETDDSP